MTDIDDNDFDNQVDEEIVQCLSLENSSSFFMFAGAGSGKTRSLVGAIESVIESRQDQLRLRGQYVGVVTYTNAACDEIKRRIDFNPLVKVSTIHSFVWNLIEGFNADIKEWLEVKLKGDITELEAQQLKSRGVNKTSINRAKKIDSKKKRLLLLGDIKKFIYNPDGDNVERDSLNHSEVIGIAAHFISTKATMQQILMNRFPILLIDESQDTNALLMDAVMTVQGKYPESFSVGLFGDTMQRIYNDGKIDLGRNLPADWKKPVKVMNHRSPARIVKLINQIRAETDGQTQRSRRDKGEGIVRFFILPSNAADKEGAEKNIASQMSEITADTKWLGTDDEVKKLILEHHMASTRMGFNEMFEPLYKVERLKTGLIDGSLPGIRFFAREVLPVVEARAINDEFAVANIVRQYSPLLKKQTLRKIGENQVKNLQKACVAVDSLNSLWADGSEPTFGDVILEVARSGLFTIPESLRFFTARTDEEKQIVTDEDADDNSEKSDSLTSTDAWEVFFASDFSQLSKYVSYIEGKSGFGTHQGVKGLEFPRVMVIMDDTEARGFLFGYEKLFGAKARSKADLENELAGKDSGIERTKRLFYVTCSRSEESLALVAYTENPRAVRAQLLKNSWFSEDEIIDVTS